jgi:hypothetical protein
MRKDLRFRLRSLSSVGAERSIKRIAALWRSALVRDVAFTYGRKPALWVLANTIQCVLSESSANRKLTLRSVAYAKIYLGSFVMLLV